MRGGHGIEPPDKSHPGKKTSRKKPPGFLPPGKKPIDRKASWTKNHPEKKHHVKIQLGKKPAVENHFTISHPEIYRTDKKQPGKNPSWQKTIMTKSHIDEKQSRQINYIFRL